MGKLVELTRPGQIVNFSHYYVDHLYYTIEHEDNLYQFPVPISDIGNATFNNSDKASMFRRYIRKAIKDELFIKVKSLIPENTNKITFSTELSNIIEFTDMQKFTVGVELQNFLIDKTPKNKELESFSVKSTLVEIVADYKPGIESKLTTFEINDYRDIKLLNIGNAGSIDLTQYEPIPNSRELYNMIQRDLVGVASYGDIKLDIRFFSDEEKRDMRQEYERHSTLRFGSDRIDDGGLYIINTTQHPNFPSNVETFSDYILFLCKKLDIEFSWKKKIYPKPINKDYNLGIGFTSIKSAKGVQVYIENKLVFSDPNTTIDMIDEYNVEEYMNTVFNTKL